MTNECASFVADPAAGASLLLARLHLLARALILFFILQSEMPLPRPSQARLSRPCSRRSMVDEVGKLTSSSLPFPHHSSPTP